jgi:hypothetical protein
MRWFRRDPSRVTPADSLLTVQSDLQREDPIEVVHGWLDLTEQGMRWRPMKSGTGRESFSIGWREIAGIDGIRIFARGATLQDWLTIEEHSGDRIELTIPRERREDVAGILGRYLESSDREGPQPPPFAIP